MRKWVYPVILILILILFLVSCKSNEYQDFFQKGIDSLKEDKIAQAIDYFEKAKDSKETEEIKQALSYTEEYEKAKVEYKNNGVENALVKLNELAENKEKNEYLSQIIDYFQEVYETWNKELIILNNAEQLFNEAKSAGEIMDFNQAYSHLSELKQLSEKYAFLEEYEEMALDYEDQLSELEKETSEERVEIEQEAKNLEEEADKKHKEDLANIEKEAEKRVSQAEIESEKVTDQKVEKPQKSPEASKPSNAISIEEGKQLVIAYLQLDASSGYEVLYDTKNPKGEYVYGVYEKIKDSNGSFHQTTLGLYAVNPITKSVRPLQ